MFKTFLKIIPQLESSALTAMENALNSRFARVAKRFAHGLKDAILGGGIAALGLSVIDKLVNPLQKVNENINSIFQRAEDLTSQAEQFGTTAGTLLKLQTIGKASGVSPEELSTLLVKFQGALIQSRANPGETSAVSAFAGQKDTAEAFFSFLRGLKSTGQLNRDLASQDVFGERKVLALSKLLGGDLEAKLSAVSGINTGTATANIANANKVAELDRTKQAIIDAEGFQKQSGQVTTDIAEARAKAAQREQDLASKQLASYEELEHIAATAEAINTKLSEGLLKLTGYASKIIDRIEVLSRAPIVRHMVKKIGGG